MSDKLTDADLEAIEKRAAAIPDGVRADWRGTNHFELSTNDNPFWLDMHDDLAWLFAQPGSWDWMECGQSLGLVMDTFAAYKPDIAALLAEVRRSRELLRAMVAVDPTGFDDTAGMDYCSYCIYCEVGQMMQDDAAKHEADCPWLLAKQYVDLVKASE